ncbi:MAG: hypothetical protein PHU42_01910 [Patescibacteria group bacterium]|nr:hypothetical protein [Patescibacteria group bacterium]
MWPYIIGFLLLVGGIFGLRKYREYKKMKKAIEDERQEVIKERKIVLENLENPSREVVLSSSSNLYSLIGVYDDPCTPEWHCYPSWVDELERRPFRLEWIGTTQEKLVELIDRWTRIKNIFMSLEIMRRPEESDEWEVAEKLFRRELEILGFPLTFFETSEEEIAKLGKKYNECEAKRNLASIRRYEKKILELFDKMSDALGKSGLEEQDIGVNQVDIHLISALSAIQKFRKTYDEINLMFP